MHQNKRNLTQAHTPLADAVESMLKAQYVPFDVPGHKGNLARLSAFFGERCLSLDFNSRQDIDNLCHPSGVIAQAQALTAEAFGAAHAFFMIGGTTSSVQAMIMSVCAQGDKIILPRNVHVSVLNAVILAGAVPIYIRPHLHPTLGISLGITPEDIEACLRANTDAKAVLINNPTYYGICCDLRSIVKLAHGYGVKVLVDEAHGTHFAFSKRLPASAMECGADMAAVSMHKTGGSLTQSSVLLLGENVDRHHVQSIINLTRTTSASYLLLSSLDIARHNLVMGGEAEQDRVLELANSVRKKINEIGGYYAFADDIIDGKTVFDFDNTKLCIHSVGLGLAGSELYAILRDEYRIQVEFGDINNILAIFSLGDTAAHAEKLLQALIDIKKTHPCKGAPEFHYEYVEPIVKISPQRAYHMPQKRMPIDRCIGRISKDFIMCYPPGVPILAPGELITEQVVSHIRYAQEKNCTITGINTEDTAYLNVVVES